MISKIEEFQGNHVSYQETVDVKDGVVCDIYRFYGDESRDLAIVAVATNEKTPLQEVLSGDKTLEGYVSGLGNLIVRTADGEVKTYIFPGEKVSEVEVRIGDKMQWQSVKNLVFYEICTPPYASGRFRDIDGG